MREFIAVLIFFSVFLIAACDNEDVANDTQPDDEQSEIDSDDATDDTTEDDTTEDEVSDESVLTVEFYDYTGDVVETLHITEQDDFIFPEGPEKDGYSFSHWDLNLAELDFSEDTKSVEPVFEVLTYTVVIEGPYGEMDSFMVEHGDALDLQTPEKEGYAFVGFDDYPDQVYEDLVIEAHFEALEDNEIVIRFFDEDEMLIKEETYEHSQDIVPPQDMEKTDYEFIGWAFDLNGAHIDLEDLETGDYDLYARYQPEDQKMVDIYFEDGQGNTIKHIEKPLDASLEEGIFPDIEEREDYEFSHWAEQTYYDYEIYYPYPVYQEDDIIFEAHWDGVTDTWLFDVVDDEAKLTEYLGDELDIVIPDEIGGKNVGVIGTDLFGVSFPSSSELTSLHIGEHVHTIEDYAFENNQTLNTVTYGNPDAIRYIGESAFRNVEAEGLLVPSYLSHIGDRAFDSANVEQAEFLGDLENIGERAFSRSSLSGDIGFPQSLRTIEDQAFRYTDLDSLTLNDGLETIGTQAFEDNGSIETLFIPNSVHTMEQEAFSGLGALHTVTFESQSPLEELAPRLFSEATNLSDITLPDNLITIRGNVFRNNEGITELDLPESANDFRAEAFADMRALETFEFPEGITEIEHRLFRYSESLETIILPDTLEIIKNRVFQGTAIKTLALPEGVEEIWNGAFEATPYLETLTLPDSLHTLGATAFRDAASLETINIPHQIEVIEYNMFKGAHSLHTVELDAQITEIEWEAFEGTHSLEHLYLPDSLHTLGHSVFARSGVSQVYIPMGATDVGTRLFEDANNAVILFGGTMSMINDSWHWNFNPESRPIFTNIENPQDFDEDDHEEAEQD